MAYRQVDILRGSGFPAYALHLNAGFHYSWFANNTAVAYASDIEWTEDDILVIPEVAVESLIRNFPVPRLVIFNQNCYYTFQGRSERNLRLTETSSPYLDYDRVIAALCVSEDSREYLAHAFPSLRLFRIHLSVDSTIFYPNFEKQKQIAFMPRKNQEHAIQVLNVLKYRGALKGYEISPIDACGEMQVAELLRRANMFFSFGSIEGWPLPPAEAMSCGALVIGYHGMGGKEYFRSEFSYPVAINDILGFCKTAENVIRVWEEDRGQLLDKAKAAQRYISTEYSTEREKRDVVSVWREIY